MPDPPFPEKRTRSQLALPDDILKVPQRSPMKDAKKARTAPRSSTKSPDGTEDELLLSPRKREGRSKRSATPEPQGEYSSVFGPLSCSREFKRVKRDVLEERKDVSGQMAQYTLPLDSRHTPYDSESNLPVKGNSRRRSTKKKPMSSVSTSPPPSVYSPLVSPKGRAQSVPLLTSTVDMPRIDFRNLPPTPMRLSSSPVKEKLRITSGTSLKSSLPTISDEQIFGMDISDGSTSIPEEKELPPVEEPVDLQPLGSGPVPATPMTASLNKLIPMSPLTPITETPFVGPAARDIDTASRYNVGTGWSQSIFKDFELSESTPKTANPPSTINSRLPRLIASSSNHSAKPLQPLIAGPSKEPNRGTLKTTGRNTVTANKKNAFELLMKKPLQAKAKLEGRTKGTGAQNSNMSTMRIPQPSIFTESKVGEKPATPLNKPGLKERMRPRSKPKTPKRPLLVPMEDDEEHTSCPDVDAEHESAKQSPYQGPATLVSSAQVEIVVQKKDHTGLSGAQMTVEDHPFEAAAVQITPVTTEIDSAPSIPADKPVNEMNEGHEPSQSQQPASGKTRPSKLPLGKKRQPISVAPAGRITRSVSKQKDQAESVRQKKQAPSALKRTASGRVKKSAPHAEETSAMNTDPIDETQSLPPGSPMRTSSPVKTPPRNHPSTVDDETQTIDFGAGKLTLAKSPARSKSFIKPASTPSPTKIARATSMFIKPTITNLTPTFQMDLGHPTSAAGSSLSTLSNALEKLRMPPPSRPNTSMGFNEDLPGDDDDISKPSTKDDAALGDKTLGRSAVGLKRSVTLGASVFRAAQSSERKMFVQKPLSTFMSAKGANNGSGKVVGRKLSAFGVGGPIRRTISKKSSLPMVIGSPVKGGNEKQLDSDPAEEASESAGNDSFTFSAPLNTSTGSLTPGDLEGGLSSKGKEKATSKTSNASRRVSMVSHALSQSLSSLPQSSNQGLMGPPPAPPAPGQYPASASEKSSPRAGPSNAVGTRSSARIATKISQSKVQDDAQTSEDADTAHLPTNPVPESLKILNNCVVFVDVRTDEGDEAGSLFVEMLEGVGAKVLSRVGQTCTHIVYKNGLMSTLTRYRLLRDPKPLVVGIGWVVECVEHRMHVDETSHLVDLEDMNVAGINKRRRSILPKLLADASNSSPLANENGEEEEREDSVNLSASCDDLAPLERARKRKSMIVGLHS